MVHLICQISVWMGSAALIPYAAWVKQGYLYTLVIPVVVYRLYVPGCWGALCAFAGTALNRLVIAQNGGLMPVFPSLSRYTGYFQEGMLGVVDQSHLLGSQTTRLAFLADWIDTGAGILSIGDLFIHGFVGIVVYAAIRAMQPVSC